MIDLSSYSCDELRELLERVLYDSAYGCLTRQGLDLYWENHASEGWLIFLDIDNMHDLNALLGYDRVDLLIRESLKIRENHATREADIFTVARYLSGDEIIFLISPDSDARGMIERLKKRFHANGLTAMFGYAWITPEMDLHQTIKIASYYVQAQKRARDEWGG